ncbi:hypothetical protein PI125_g12067 [Phytophthora idaei]|nr:hypothetical protein PI125_g12067 [Phytophthora idaei]
MKGIGGRRRESRAPSCLTGDVVGSVAPSTLRVVGELSDAPRGDGTGQGLTEVETVAVVGESRDRLTAQDKDEVDAVAVVCETSEHVVIITGETRESSPPSGAGLSGELGKDEKEAERNWDSE